MENLHEKEYGLWEYGWNLDMAKLFMEIYLKTQNKEYYQHSLGHLKNSKEIKIKLNQL